MGKSIITGIYDWRWEGESTILIETKRLINTRKDNPNIYKDICNMNSKQNIRSGSYEQTLPQSKKNYPVHVCRVDF